MRLFYFIVGMILFFSAEARLLASQPFFTTGIAVTENGELLFAQKQRNIW